MRLGESWKTRLRKWGHDQPHLQNYLHLCKEYIFKAVRSQCRVWAPGLASIHTGFKGSTIGVAFGCLSPALGSDPGLGKCLCIISSCLVLRAAAVQAASGSRRKAQSNSAFVLWSGHPYYALSCSWINPVFSLLCLITIIAW